MENGKGKTVAIVILVILLLGAIGYIVYDKVFNKEVKEPVKTEEKVASEENLNDISAKLINKINSYKLDLLDVYGNDITVSTVPTKEQLDTMFFYLSEKTNADIENLIMTKEDVDNYFNELYGITPSEYPDIVCKLDNVVEYTYDDTKKAYLFNNDAVAHAHGGYWNNSLSQIVTNIKKENGNYVLDVAKLYAGSMLDMAAGHYYSDATYSNLLTDFDQFFGADTTGEYDNERAISYFQSNKEQYKDVKPQYRYTFKKENDNYYIIKYEVIK